MQLPVYLDYAATTPVDPRVGEKMSRYLGKDGHFGNPASRSHIYGWRAEEAVEIARREVADLLGCDPREIVWTSGATEADNLALKGAAAFHADKGRHIVTSLVEHKAVLDTCGWLESEGFDVSYLQPDSNGAVSAEQVADALRADTILVSLMHVNNETGVINDIAAIGKVVREHGARFHVDAAQSAGKLPIDLAALPVDLMSVSAHKIYGPKGIGALFVRRDPPAGIIAQIHGGGHERGMRSGTLPTHQIVGMGEAFRIAGELLSRQKEDLTALRERLLSGLSEVPGWHINSDPACCVPGIMNLAFDDVDGETLLLGLRNLALSSGSACTSASLEPSYVLRAMGVSDALAQSSLRLSMGRFTRESDVDTAVSALQQTLARLRSASLKSRVNQSV